MDDNVVGYLQAPDTDGMPEVRVLLCNALNFMSSPQLDNIAVIFDQALLVSRFTKRLTEKINFK